MHVRTRYPRRLLIAVLGGGIIGCQGPNEGPGDPANGKVEQVVLDAVQGDECPDLFAVRVAGRTDLLTEIPLAGARTSIPGYQDCQRLIVAGGTEYGPEIALFASDGSHPDGAAVQVLARDGDYPTLGIRQGFNCLHADALGDGTAWMTPVVGDAEACLKPRPEGKAVATPLELRCPLSESFGTDDVPQAVRWDWDGVRAEHYIGFHLAGRWCEAGRRGFTSSTVPAAVLAMSFDQIAGVPATTQSEARRVTGVKGWYDQQRLAVPDGRGGLVPGPVTGTIVPHPLLDRLDGRTHFEAGWIPVSYVHLDGDSPTYKVKENFDPGLNTILLRYGDPSKFVPSGAAPASCATTMGWWAKVVSASGDVVHRCVAYNDHAGIEMPGSVRWRWLKDDEKTWIRCPQGCCTVE